MRASIHAMQIESYPSGQPPSKREGSIKYRQVKSAAKQIGTACARKRAATVDAERIGGIEQTRRLEIDTAASYYIKQLLLKSAAKAGGYSINLSGHPAATRKEVLSSFHRSFK